MVRRTKKKLAIFAGTSVVFGTTKCLVYAEAKYCASEIPGEIKYYECSKAEYCCGIGCCVPPGLPFHHLWYYWILVIIMFLVCSGGGWWYRYWLQGRYRTAASVPPARTSSSRAQSTLRGASCQGQRARISYNPGRNTVLLHRMWKGPHRNGANPPFNGNATTSTHYQNMSVMLNDANCPYYQLYGPPPSYETVIAQTRGKISNPATPESANAQTTMQSGSIAPNSIVPQCYAYSCNSSTRLNATLEQNIQFANGSGASSRQIDRGDGGISSFAHFPRYCTVADGTIRQDVCIPFAYQDQSFVPRNGFNAIYRGDSTNDGAHTYDPYAYGQRAEISNTLGTENQSYQAANTEMYTTMKFDCKASGSRKVAWQPDRVIKDANGRVEEDPEHQSENTQDIKLRFPSTPTSVNHTNDSKSAVNSLDDFDMELSRNRRVCGGSLRAAGRYGSKEICDEYSVQRAFSKILPRSCDGLINTEPATSFVDNKSINVHPLEFAGNASTSSFQSNPSNNVILERLISGGESSLSENTAEPGSRVPDASTNSDVESKTYRLDRSKSLD